MAIEVEGKIKEVIVRTYNVKSLRVDVGKVIDFKAGQYLIVTLNNGLKKPLSISNSPTETGYIEFTKKLTDSEFSKALNELKPGDTLKLKYPLGSFTFEGQYKKIAFLSGGIGITPIRGIVKYVADKKLGTDIVLIYGNRTRADVVFKEDFDIIQNEYPKLKVIHVFSQEDTQGKCRSGHISCQLVKEEIPDYNERWFYLCGPPAMVEGMERILSSELGLPKEKIIKENFAGY